MGANAMLEDVMGALTNDRNATDCVSIGGKLVHPNNDTWSRVLCPITGCPCEGDLSYLCDDYGCARKGGLSPYSDENL
jgi:hypothetical protein